ncbi:MAG: type II CAAX prenyl endopeptidase Rce1 family protein [Gemmatimonadales bacterium]
MTIQQYAEISRQPRYSVLFALPLLLLYEGLAAILSGSAMAGVRNGADVLLKSLFLYLGGREGVLVFGVFLVGLGGWVVWRDMGRHGADLSGRVFAAMLVESLLYAAVLGQVVAVLTASLLGGSLVVSLQGPLETLPLASQLVVSLGAGLYEELLFRVLLVSGFLALGLRAGWKRPLAVAFAVFASALVFSAFHYIGPYGDRLTVASFTFRTVAGLVLSGLYVTRGFGITAWSHALYDVGLAVM